MNTNFTDVENEFNGVTETSTRERLHKLASGTVTVQTTTTAYDVDFADISIAAGDLTANDTIIIEYMANNVSNKAIDSKINFNNITTPGSYIELSTVLETVNSGGGTYKLIQDPKTSDIIIGSHVKLTNITMDEITSSYDTNDPNIFTTAFTIRLNFKNATQPADVTTVIRWVAYRIPG